MNLHPDFRPGAEAVLEALLAAYPAVRPPSVELYGREGDRSLGRCDKGRILLNAYWFARPKRFFDEAVARARASEPSGAKPWHGRIGAVDREFDRLLAHEFGHLLMATTPAAVAFARRGRAAALVDPDLAVSGYALADDPGEADEWFAETFAALCLGGAGSSQVEEMEAFLGSLSRADSAEWREADHPRDKGGQFSTKPGFAAASTHGPSGRTGPGGAPLPEHVRKLRIPPAWTDVRYAEDPDSALLVVGRDSKGREQRIYSERFSRTQAEAKFRRIEVLSREIDEIKARNTAAKADPRRRDAAEATELVMATGIRPGSEADTGAEKRAYGATTLEGRHVVASDGGVRLRFVGKKGVNIDIAVADRSVARMLARRALEAGPDGKLFPDLTDAALRSHVKDVAGKVFKVKDFRTLLGTRMALELIKAEVKHPTNVKEYKKAVLGVAKKVSSALGNTPTVALQSYIAPEVFGGWRIAASA